MTEYQHLYAHYDIGGTQDTNVSRLTKTSSASMFYNVPYVLQFDRLLSSVAPDDLSRFAKAFFIIRECDEVLERLHGTLWHEFNAVEGAHAREGWRSRRRLG